MRRAIEHVDCRHEGARIPITVSVGVSTVRKGPQRATDLYREADQALYESKRTGRNRVTVAPA
ncbi:MAG: diguanylate cyclase [Acidobacteria bacterium]|nr:diguanylate cyclase [Acidobacteriota bacterium]